MAASFNVYQDRKNYGLHYPKNRTNEEEVPIESMHIFPKKGVWIVIDVDSRTGRQGVEQSLNIISSKETFAKMRPPELIDIDITNIKYFYKDSQITFHSKEATYEYRVARYVGDDFSRGKIRDLLSPSTGVSEMHYDLLRNRINLVIASPVVLQEKKLSSPNPFRVSSS